MSLRNSHRRALRRIEWELVRSDQRLTALFASFTAEAAGRAMPQAEQSSVPRLGWIRRLGWRSSRHRAGQDPRLRPRTIP